MQTLHTEIIRYSVLFLYAGFLRKSEKNKCPAGGRRGKKKKENLQTVLTIQLVSGSTLSSSPTFEKSGSNPTGSGRK